MKKFIKSCCVALVATIVLVSTACGGGTVIESIDENKERIYITVFNGGYGTKWIKELATQWNNKNESWEVIIEDDSKPSSADIINDAITKTSDKFTSVWFSADPGFKSGIVQGAFEDLSDMLTMKVDGESRSIGDKIDINSEFYSQWKDLMCDVNGEGLYALPYAESIMGFVYDHDAFVNNNWLYFADISDKEDVISDGVECEISGDYLVCSKDSKYYSKGDRILRAGKDNKFGTYDDGQPETETEYSTMINKIRNTPNYKCYIWCEGTGSSYLYHIENALLAQYGGIEEFNTYFNYNGKMVMHNNKEELDITIDNGYKVYESEALYQVYKFVGKYFANENNLHDCAKKNKGAEDAQGYYLWGCRGENTNPQSAFLLDGGWWENEAKNGQNDLFQSNVDKGYSDRAYGKVDYRYMMLPNLEGQKGIDGKGNGTVFSCCDAGAILVRKTDNAEKLRQIKDFLLYTLSDSSLELFTTTTGVYRPYKYEMSKESLSKLTPFANVVHDIYNDNRNIKIVRPWVISSAQPMNFAAGNNTYKTTFMPTKLNGVLSNSILNTIKQKGTADEAFECLYYSEADWAKYVQTARNNGFYK